MLFDQVDAGHICGLKCATYASEDLVVNIV